MVEIVNNNEKNTIIWLQSFLSGGSLPNFTICLLFPRAISYKKEWRKRELQ